MRFYVILFDGFETLDAMGPVEVFGAFAKAAEGHVIQCCSEKGGTVEGAQGVRIQTLPLTVIEDGGVLLIPGGMGTRREVTNAPFLSRLADVCERAQYVLAVCTGSALLAKAGVLKEKRATSNKMAFAWASAQDADVVWVRRARWVRDGKYYTSSGVSAGIDMALGFISDIAGESMADAIARRIEYLWNRDPNTDPFCE